MSHNLTADEAAELIQHGDTVGFSGFTPAGAPKAVPHAIAARAERLHRDGQAVQDRRHHRRLHRPVARRRAGQGRRDLLPHALPVRPRPAQEHQRRRDRVLRHAPFADAAGRPLRVSGPDALGRHRGLRRHRRRRDRAHLLGRRRARPSAGAPSKIIIELNRFHPPRLRGIHDIYEPPIPPHRREIPVYRPSDRIGAPDHQGRPRQDRRHRGDRSATTRPAASRDDRRSPRRSARTWPISSRPKLRSGLIPRQFLPIQSGVGDTANAVLGAMGSHPDIPRLRDVHRGIQDSVIALMQQGKSRSPAAAR